jgi:hypothetical protein
MNTNACALVIFLACTAGILTSTLVWAVGTRNRSGKPRQ